MPFNPDEFNTVGIKIAAGGTEAELRTGISRIYYYLFLHAREQLLVRGLVNAGQICRKGSHKAVITAIRKINRDLTKPEKWTAVKRDFAMLGFRKVND